MRWYHPIAAHFTCVLASRHFRPASRSSTLKPRTSTAHPSDVYIMGLSCPVHDASLGPIDKKSTARTLHSINAVTPKLLKIEIFPMAFELPELMEFLHSLVEGLNTRCTHFSVEFEILRCNFQIRSLVVSIIFCFVHKVLS